MAPIPAERVKARMESLELRKAELEAKLEQGKDDNVILHPNTGRIYRTKVANLVEALNQERTRAEAADLLRGLIDAVYVEFGKDGKDPEITLQGSLAGILSLSHAKRNVASISEDDIRQVKLVAGAGFEPATFRL